MQTRKLGYSDLSIPQAWNSSSAYKPSTRWPRCSRLTACFDATLKRTYCPKDIIQFTHFGDNMANIPRGEDVLALPERLNRETWPVLQGEMIISRR